MCAESNVMVCPACDGLAVTRGHMAVCTECWWLSPDVRDLVAPLRAATQSGAPELVVCAEPDLSEDYAGKPAAHGVIHRIRPEKPS